MINYEFDISVVMSVYNTPIDILEQAIDSILSQTKKDFEFIIINDGSEETVSDWLKHVADCDERIVVIENENNKGLPASLNIGIAASKGKYIARMDSDDISEKDRFAIQFRYMEENPDVAAVGSYAYELGTDRLIKPHESVDQEYRRIEMEFLNAGVIHPSAFLRKDFLDRLKIVYDENCLKAQDYELWSRLIQVGLIESINTPLIHYRVYDKEKRKEYHESQDRYAYAIRANLLARHQIGLTATEEDVYLKMADYECSEHSSAEYQRLIKKLLAWNKDVKVFEQKHYESFLMFCFAVRAKRWAFSGKGRISQYMFLLRMLKPYNLSYAIHNIRLLRR